MTEKMSYAAFLELLARPETTQAEVRARNLLVLDQAQSDAFAPRFRPNPETVEDEGLAGDAAIGVFNWLARQERRRIYDERIRSGGAFVRVVSEGDSWFQYPVLLTDIIDVVIAAPRFAVRSLGGAGHRLIDMVQHGEVFEAARREAPDVVLISGGGNDLLGGGRLARYLHPFDAGRTPDAYPNDRFEAQLRRLAATFEQLFLRLARERPGVHILCHGYDHAVPRGDGKWLGRPMASLGIVQPDLQRDIVRVIVDRLNDVLIDLSRRHAGVVNHVDCRRVVAEGEWRDELHPEDAGYAKLAARFIERIDDLVKRRRLASLGGAPLCPGREAPTADRSPAIDDAVKSRIVTRRARVHLGAARGPIRLRAQDRQTLERDISDFFEKVHMGADFQPARFLDDGSARAAAVCRINLPGGFGTGFLVADGRFIMTNNHVLETRETARGSVAEFGFEDGGDTVSVTLRPDRFFVTDVALDFTIVACDGAPVADIAPIPLLRNPATVAPSERVNIVQHPRGRQKQIAIRNNEVIGLKQSVVHYRTDTEPGSSGSPVFNDRWDLVALHHAGWRQNGAATNEGIRLSAIVANLMARQRAGRESSLALTELLATVTDSSPLLGFFDLDGVAAPDVREVEVPDFTGTPNFADIGFWNIEHFNQDVTDARVDRVADVVSRLSMDVMGLVEVQAPALRRLAGALRRRGDEVAFELLDTPGRQDIAVLFDTDTATVQLADDVMERHRAALSARTSAGRTAFPRFPLFARCVVSDDNAAPVRFMMIVVHFKAFGDPQSRARRRLASRVLAEIIADIREREAIPVILGGDFNEVLTNDVLADFTDTADLFAMTADDARSGAATYVGSGRRSLIDHIMISDDLRPGQIAGDDAAIVRLDRGVARFSRDVSDHVPIVMRLVMRDAPLDTTGTDTGRPDRRIAVPEGADRLEVVFHEREG